MRIRRFTLLAAGLFFAASGTAGAQEAGKAGVTIAYPAAIGVIWHVTDTVAIRPAFAFGQSSSDVSLTTNENRSTNIALDLGVLFYVKKYDNVRTYVSPRFQYQHTSSTSTTGGAPTTQAEIKSTGTLMGGAGVFGAQYSPAARFSVFGEVGFSFNHRDTHLESNPSAVAETNTWGTTAGVGVIFYF